MCTALPSLYNMCLGGGVTVVNFFGHGDDVDGEESNKESGDPFTRYAEGDPGRDGKREGVVREVYVLLLFKFG